MISILEGRKVFISYMKDFTINTDLYHGKRIATNLDNELVIIKRKSLAADYQIY